MGLDSISAAESRPGCRPEPWRKSLAYRDLRQFLNLLEENGQLVKIKDPVMPEPDVTAAAHAALRLGSRAPALLFENIRGYNNRLVLNMHGSWANHALMLGMPKDATIREQFFELDRRWPGKPGACQWAKSAPCKDVKLTGDINLFSVLPLHRGNCWDGGCYLAKGCVVSRDPEDPGHFGKQNVGIYRMQVIGRDMLNIQPLVFHDLAVHFRKAEEAGKPLPIAIALGNEPIITFMAGTPIEYDQSEYEFAAALQGEPYKLIKAETSDLDLPAGAEVILEGEILPRKRSVEGPFGEFTGSYSGARKQPQVRIHTITHRKDPIFENLCLGKPWTEIDYLLALNTSVPLYRQVKASFPEVAAVNAMYVHGIVAIIATKSRMGGYGKAVAMRLLTTPHGMAYTKFVIVVDDSVDPFNLSEVMWALATRVNPDKHLSLIKNCPGMPLDPSSEPPGMHTKVIIDATTPVAPEPVARETFLLEEAAQATSWAAILRELIQQQEVRS